MSGPGAFVTISAMKSLSLISLVASLYIYWRAVHPLHCRRIWKALLALLILCSALFFPALRIIGGPLAFGPDIPSALLLTYAWLYMVCMAYFLILLGVSIIHTLLVRWLPAWKALLPERQKTLRNRLNFILLAVSALLVSLGEHNALTPPIIKQITIPLPIAKPLRIALLTDLHVDAVKHRDFMRHIVALTNEQHPDIVLLAGDFVDGSVEQRGADMEPLKELRAPAYAVLGNHEYYSGYETWAPYLASLGLRVLHNEHAYLEGAQLTIAGVTDPAARAFGYEEPNVQKAIAGAPAERPILLLAHQPKLIHQAENQGIALQLSGHTHGGLMPGLSHITAGYNSGYVNGLYRTPAGTLLYVSPGTSLWSGIPLRIGTASEITLITLHPAPQTQPHHTQK